MGILDYVVQLRPTTRNATVLCLGLDKAGKTSILRQLSGEDITHVPPTHGFVIKALETRGVKLNVWDVGGQAKMRFYWRQYYDEVDLLIFVFDIADPARFDEVRSVIKQLMTEESLAGVPILFFANKSDLSFINPEVLIEKLRLDRLTGTRFWQLKVCSAKNGSGIMEGIAWVFQRVKKKHAPTAVA